jgi:hypothetical protein
MVKEEDLVAAVNTIASTTDERKTLRCADAFRIAEEMQVEVAAIGRICNKNGIKLIQCQLGCFK